MEVRTQQRRSTAIATSFFYLRRSTAGLDWAVTITTTVISVISSIHVLFELGPMLISVAPLLRFVC